MQKFCIMDKKGDHVHVCEIERDRQTDSWGGRGDGLWGDWCWICSLSAAAAAESLQSCLTLCDPVDSSPPGSPVPGILKARTLEWVAISFSNSWKWKVKVKSLSRVQLFAIPWTAAHQAPPSMGFSRQEYWSGVPLPSPVLSLGFPNNFPCIKSNGTHDPVGNYASPSLYKNNTPSEWRGNKHSLSHVGSCASWVVASLCPQRPLWGCWGVRAGQGGGICFFPQLPHPSPNLIRSVLLFVLFLATPHTCGILAPHVGMEPETLRRKRGVFTYWTTRKSRLSCFYFCVLGVSGMVQWLKRNSKSSVC